MLKKLKKENKVEEEKGEKETVSNQTLNTEKSEENKIQNNNNNPNTNEKLENKDEKEKTATIFNFWDYLIYKIIFCKKNNNIDLELFENFRKHIISVEHLIENYLRMKNLLKSENSLQK